MAETGKTALQQQHKELVTGLAAVIKISQLHDQSNDAVVKARASIRSLANQLVEEQGELTLKLVGD